MRPYTLTPIAGSPTAGFVERPYEAVQPYWDEEVSDFVCGVVTDVYVRAKLRSMGLKSSLLGRTGTHFQGER